MLKITSFSALIVGILIALPMIFSDAQAGRTIDGAALKSNREPAVQLSDNRISAAFQLVDVCSPTVTGDAGSWCAARDTAADQSGAVAATTIEFRDESGQTSTLATVPTLIR